jgi:tripartite-type tricarboxylate transporter receptor subunit TctC
MFGNLPVAVPHVNGGKLRALANTSGSRSPLAPQVPTVAESGFPDFAIATWYGMLGPAGLPPDLAARIQRDVSRLLNQPETRERLVGMGVDIIANSPEEFAAFLRAEVARYAKVVKDQGLKAE